MIRNLGFVFMIDHVFKTYKNNYENNFQHKNTFQGPGFLGYRFISVQVFQGPGPGFRSSQDLRKNSYVEKAR